MSTSFGPQLIGETEKTLNALLRRFLDSTGLTEPQWVTLRLAGQLDDSVDERDSLRHWPIGHTSPMLASSSNN
jgi:hypothetical protein